MCPVSEGFLQCRASATLTVQGEAAELVIRLLIGQQKKHPSDKALKSGIGRTMLQAYISC